MLLEIYFIKLEDLVVSSVPLEDPEDISLSKRNKQCAGIILENQYFLSFVDQVVMQLVSQVSIVAIRFQRAEAWGQYLTVRDKMNTVTATSKKAGMTHRDLQGMANRPWNSWGLDI